MNRGMCTVLLKFLMGLTRLLIKASSSYLFFMKTWCEEVLGFQGLGLTAP